MSRHEDILALIQEYTFLKVEDACSRLGVSPATVRRDFAEMEQLGLLKRVTGGAIGTEKQNAEEPGSPNLSEKRRIAEKAVSLVLPGTRFFWTADRPIRKLPSCSPRAGTFPLLPTASPLRTFWIIAPTIFLYLSAGETSVTVVTRPALWGLPQR